MRIRRTKQSSESQRPCTAMFLLGLMALSVLLAGVGCAHQKAYKRGAKLSEQGQYDRAIQELEEAVALAEESHDHKAVQRYREKLEAVKREAGHFYYRQAEDRFAQADLGAAQMLIERCIKCLPQEQPYWAFRQRVHKAIADAEQLRAEALSLAEQRQWKAAVERMTEALHLYRTLPGGQGDLKQIKERAYQYYVARAQDRLHQDDLEAAQAEAQVALTYRDAGREAQAVLRTVADRREAAGLIARGRTLLEQGDCEEALRTLERAHQLHPSHAELPDLLGRARRSVCDRWISHGRQAMEAGKYATALGLFRNSGDLLEGYGGVDALEADARSRLAETHLESSRQHLDSGASGCAVLHAAAALGYEPQNFEARRQLGQSAGRVRDEVRYVIAFLGFRTAPEHRAVADAFGAAALEHLTQARPVNVVLVERIDLRKILDKHDFNISEPVDPRFHLPAGKLHGLDALIVGQLLDSRVMSETKQTGHGESTYQDGFRSEPNPDYAHAAAEVNAALRELERARRRLAEAEARLARYEHADPDDANQQARKRKAKADVAEARQRLVNAATDVGAAELRLAATPQQILVPNLVKHRYPIQTATWTAKVSCMLKMLDTATGELLLAERLEGKYVRSDRFVSADPARNVPEDPVELPDDATMLGRAADSAVERLKRALDTACVKHGDRFVVRMRRAEAAGAAVEAVDSCVKYLFAYPAGYEHTNKMLSFLRAYLGEENQLIDIREPLRTRCRILLR